MVLPPPGDAKSSDRLWYDMVGFFQSPYYFQDVLSKPELHAMLDPTGEFRRNARRVLADWYAPPSSSLLSHETTVAEDDAADAVLDQCHMIGVHVRRGDYTTLMKGVFEELDFTGYYDKALHLLLGGSQLEKLTRRVSRRCASTRDVLVAAAKGSPIRVLVFCDASDTLFASSLVGAWRVKYPGLYVTLVSEVQEECRPDDPPSSKTFPNMPPRDVVELFTMAACDDLIMANSTFSWWAAYLQAGPGRVVAPAKWFVKEPFPSMRHLYDAGWILV